MNTKSPGRSNAPNSNPGSNGGANFAPMTFAGK